MKSITSCNVRQSQRTMTMNTYIRKPSDLPFSLRLGNLNLQTIFIFIFLFSVFVYNYVVITYHPHFQPGYSDVIIII